ncbi:MAG: N-acyl-D-amino-acid deacylase family protein [Candidatus Aminicenantia bacterium]
MRLFFTGFLKFAIFLCLLNLTLLSDERYDIIIKNGKLFDGSSNPWIKADIGIKGKKIKRIGFIEESEGRKVINADGLIVSPGFIDVHTHTEDIVLRPTIENYVYQGVTTVIAGNCGFHEFPLSKFFKKLKKIKISINFGSLIGHNTIRKKVMDDRATEPTEEELRKMESLLEKELKAGGLGLSTGLEYIPGTYSRTEEIIRLGKIVAKYHGIYATHLRNEDIKINPSIIEAIKIAEANKIPLEISHIKLCSEKVWGKLELILNPVEEARKRGVEIFMDQYPYLHTSTSISILISPYALEGGLEKFKERVKNTEFRENVKREISQKLTSEKINKLKNIFIANYKNAPEYNGKSLEEILVLKGKAPDLLNASELIIEIVENGDSSAVFLQMKDEDVKSLMKLPYVSIASDGAVQFPSKGFPHPRSYGTFPRIISKYVREEKILSIEDAIRKMTSLPAEVFRIKERGMIKENFFADLLIFDLEEIKDNATFQNPHQYPSGINYVIVNGKIVIENGKHTGERPGVLIKRR